MSTLHTAELEQRLNEMPGVRIRCPDCNHVIEHYLLWKLSCQLNVHTAHRCEDQCGQCKKWFPVLPNIQCDGSTKDIMRTIMENSLALKN